MLWPGGLLGSAEKNRPDFQSQVFRAKVASLILYDVKSRREWLVFELSAALHILIAQLRLQKLADGAAETLYLSPLQTAGTRRKKPEIFDNS